MLSIDTTLIASRLRQARMISGLTRATLARAINVCEATIEHRETKLNDISIVALNDHCRAVGIYMADLLREAVRR